MRPLFETILAHVPAAQVRFRGAAATADQRAGLLQLRRPDRHRPHHARPAQGIAAGADLRRRRPRPRRPRSPTCSDSRACERVPLELAEAGDIVLLQGIEGLTIGCTLCDPEHPEPAAAAGGGRAHAHHELPGQHLAVRRARRQVRHQPPGARAAAARAVVERGAARRGYRRRRRVPGVGPRRAAPDHSAGEHAPRGLRTGRVAPARAVPRDRRRQVRALRDAHRGCGRAASGRGDAGARGSAAASCRTCSPTAKAACGWSTASRRAG